MSVNFVTKFQAIAEKTAKYLGATLLTAMAGTPEMDCDE